MDWSKSEIRELRLRMGWSRSELARHLNCQLQEIEIWEEGGVVPDTAVCSELDFIYLRAEECSAEVHGQPILEQILDNESLGQINFSDLND